MPKYMFSQGFLDNVVKYYKTHTELETSIKFDISKRVVQRIIKNSGVEKHKPFTKVVITDEDKQFIKDNYLLLSDTAIANRLKIHTSRLYEIYKEINLIPKSHSENVALGIKLQKETCINKYGEDCVLKSDKIKEKIKQTNLQKYGETSFTKTQKYIEKTKATNLQKYGVEWSQKNKSIKKKCIETNIKKYGVKCFLETDASREANKLYRKEHNQEIQEKIEKTSYKKYGVRRPSMTNCIKDEIRKGHLSHFGCWYSQTDVRNSILFSKKDEILMKYKKTCLELYGNENYFKTNDFKNKLYITKKKNKSFNSSKPEKLFYDRLIMFFEEDDVVRQYKDNRYPFACDFYIKSLDLFIELNLHWTHGSMPYVEDDRQCIELLNNWKDKSKNSEFYKNAIKTWTIRDVNKINTAKSNGLNYLLFYNEGDIDKWLVTIQQLILED